MNSQDNSQKRALGPATLGTLVGAGFYFIIALGVFYTLFGADGWLVPEASSESGYWIGRVMSSWINLFSFMAFGAAMAILLSRKRYIEGEKRAFAVNLLDDDEETFILPEDALECRKRLKQFQPSDQRFVLVRILSAGLRRARANWSAEDAGTAIKSQAEVIQGESDSAYATVKYLAWAIPSIGFVGTVLGIGQAMASLDTGSVDESFLIAAEQEGTADNQPNALGDASTASGDSRTDGEETDIVLQESAMERAARFLSMAFDTTFVALVLSLFLMYFVHRVQADEDALLVRATEWCMQRFVLRMHVPTETTV